ncbi:MAG: phosphoglucosamine mutase [Acidobacteria bacterium]|nr:phosphoglucosamine mutase [Acidobacteriota bacterium]
MTTRLFGTDGIRGTAGRYPLDASTIARVGRAMVRAIGGRAPRLLTGRDTRESGAWIERELARGAGAAGASLVSAGVIPTPAIAYLVREEGFDAGIVVSASHNPYEDNGIKVFSGGGEKFGDELERRIEALVDDDRFDTSDPGAWVSLETKDFGGQYARHVLDALPERTRLGDLRLAFDCANGATARVAPLVFGAVGIEAVGYFCAPDGRNINRGCGSTHPEALAAVVRDGGFGMGVAFDGDGDRAIFVDGRGRTVDGDAVLLICAKAMNAAGRLKGHAVVATIMSNIGLEIGLREAGISLVRCPVGDKHVMQEMLARDLSLGGEQSGHIIFAEHLFTGDGLVTAMRVLGTMAESGRSLAELRDDLKKYPQVLLNVRVRERREIAAVPELARAIADVERELSKEGRVVIRYSGTEPLLRIMLEGPDAARIHAWADGIADVARQQLG